MREIGSEFWDVPVAESNNGLFPEFTQWFLSGRSALRAVIKEIGEARSVSLPSWCCDSMIKPFIEANYRIHFYPVYWQDSLVQEPSMECDVLLLLDYFGYSTSVTHLKGYKGIVIRDITHSLMSSTYNDADYYFGSLRKWCGIWTGGYAWRTDGIRLPEGKDAKTGYVRLREKAMQQKHDYINGCGSSGKKYLELFKAAEEYLEKPIFVSGEDRDINLARKLDVDYIRSRRKSNAKVLIKAFPDWLIFPEIKDSDCPMFVPILVPDGRRDELRRYLIENKIYCPIHWPESAYHKLDEMTEKIYRNELSLVCDQRYSEDDMNRMIEVINIWKGAR